MPARTLKQIHEECISLTKHTSPKLINGGKVSVFILLYKNWDILVKTNWKFFNALVNVLLRSSLGTLYFSGSLYKWRGYVGSFIIGELKFDGLPNFSLNIFDETHVLPCLILNPAKNLKKLLKLYGHVVIVNDPELVVEMLSLLLVCFIIRCLK